VGAGRSALAAYWWRRATELAARTRSLAWRVPLVAAAGLAADVLAAQVGLPRAELVGLMAAALVGWRLRFRPSEQARTWRRGAAGERRTARLLDRLTRDGFVVVHDLAVPGNTSANLDHLVIRPSGAFVIDSSSGPAASTRAAMGSSGTTTTAWTAPAHVGCVVGRVGSRQVPVGSSG
jgi:hypothetical protein